MRIKATTVIKPGAKPTMYVGRVIIYNNKGDVWIRHRCSSEHLNKAKAKNEAKCFIELLKLSGGVLWK